MASAALSSIDTPKRYIDPNAPLALQTKVLQELIKNPPENSRIVTVSPELAGWVVRPGGLNTQNRKKRQANIKKFSASMAENEFFLTGDTIKFGRSGRLIDGQNRLFACVRAGVAFRTHIVFGIDDACFPVFDTGASRSNPDTLEIAGVRNSREAALAVRWLMIMGSDPKDRGRSITNTEILEYYRKSVKHDDLDWAVAGARAVGRKIPTGHLACHLYRIKQTNARYAERFLSELKENVRWGRALRVKFAALKNQFNGRIHENVSNACIILAWNAFRKNARVAQRLLEWTENKGFPSIE